MDWQDKKVLIVGMARSGIAAARVLVEKKALVTLTDLKNADELREQLQQIKDMPIKIVTGRYPNLEQEDFDLVVTSPGVPADSPLLTSAVCKKIPVWSELELASSFLQGEMVAVTGTNGKTTTTALVGEIFKDAGYDTVVAGNIGIPLVQEAERTDENSITAVEVSSFQLEWVEQFHPRVAVMLNLTPDHLDRHQTFQNYAEIKSRIFLNQDEQDFTIINYDDQYFRYLDKMTGARVIFFSTRHILERGVFLDKGEVVAELGQGRQRIIAADQIRIPGPHNLENALAAIAAALVLGVKPESIAATLKRFSGVRHRLEEVGRVKGITYINDSKATNPDAAIKALQSFQENIILIAGGRHKGASFEELAKMIKEKVKGLVLVGEAASILEEAVLNVGFSNLIRAEGFADVVRQATEMAEPGDVVLLSPACASWDMFRNYEERGDEFRQQVTELDLLK